MGKKQRGMHASIGSATADGLDILLAEGSNGLIEILLNSDGILLYLPTVIRGPFERKLYKISVHNYQGKDTLLF